MRKNKKKMSALRQLLLKIQTGAERNIIIENLGMMIGSGMAITEAIDGIVRGLKSKKLKDILIEASHEIQSGSFVWKAFDRTNLFADHTISLIRIGEESGNLPENLKVIATQQEKERSFNSRLRSALLYPLLVFTITVVIGVGISWFILPRLAGVFSSLKIDLPIFTKILIRAGQFLGDYGYIAIPVFFLLFLFIVYIVFLNHKTKHIGEKLIEFIPGINQLITQIEIARMGFIIGTLLNAGLPIIRSLESLKDATNRSKYNKLYKHFIDSLNQGFSFKKSFQTYKNIDRTISPTIQQMIVSAERSGNLPDSFIKIGEIFEAKSEITTKNLVVLLEPVLLVVVWLGVVLVALSVILPIYSMIGQFN